MSEAQLLRPPAMLGRHLVETGRVTQDQLEQALAEQTRNPGLGLGEVLVEQGALDEAALLEALADLGYPVVDLATAPLAPEAAAAVPEAVARRFGVVPVSLEGETVVVASTHPGTRLATELTFLLGRPVRVVAASRRAIAEALDALYRLQVDLAAAHGHGGSAGFDAAAAVNEMLSQGLRARASDIHLEPQGEHLLVRYRIDGVLHDGQPLPGALAARVISRIKVLAGLNIVEKLQPQDGQIQMRVEDRDLDIRVSTIPSVKGEKAVLRLLERQRVFTLEKLGFRPHHLAQYRSLLDRPFGLMVVAGPTGAGKTSTLYATLQEVDTTHRNVITLEDPVEYVFPRITQVAVNPRAGISFATGLRAILRQDPDVIVVGETRDAETARIAVQASLTGHLVLTSLHANEALGAVYRLLDIGVEPYLLASALSGVVAQRLVRQVCSRCGQWQPLADPEAAFLARMGLPPLPGQRRGGGCPFCGQTGYSGRTGVYSILRVDAPLRRLIARAAPVGELAAAARAAGYTGLLAAGLELVQEGATTVAELMRVIGADLS